MIVYHRVRGDMNQAGILLIIFRMIMKLIAIKKLYSHILETKLFRDQIVNIG